MGRTSHRGKRINDMEELSEERMQEIAKELHEHPERYRDEYREALTLEKSMQISERETYQLDKAEHDVNHGVYRQLSCS